MTLGTIEYPEELERQHPIVNLRASADNFIYLPLENVEWSVAASPQTRHLMAVQISNGEAKILRVIDYHYTFRDLIDFIPEDKATAGLELDGSCILDLLAQDSFDANRLVLPPSCIFSAAQLPFALRELRISIKASISSPWSDESGTRLTRSWNVSFLEEHVPSGPCTESINRAKNVPLSHVDAVKRIFNERPVASRAFLEQRLCGSPEIVANLRIILPTIAYHWNNGPWHLLWTRHGIDPRTGAEFRRYQSIELRNRMIAKELKRGHSASSARKAPSTPLPLTNFCFDGQELALHYFTYQLCDLTYPPLAQIVENPSNFKTYLTERDGWFVEGTLARLRDAMKRRWFEMLKGADLSTLSPQKLEEIMLVIAPRSRKLALPGTIKQILAQIDVTEGEADDGEKVEFYEEDNQIEDSDYEIYDG